MARPWIGHGRGRGAVGLALAGGLVALAAPGVVRAAGAVEGTVFGDGFESGSTSAWTTAASVTAQRQYVATGVWAAELSSTGSPSYLRKKLAVTEPELRLSAAVQVVSRGPNPVTLLTARTGTGGAVASLLVTAQGRLAVRNAAAGTTTVSATAMPLGSWHTVSLGVRAGSSGRIDVTYDGTPVVALSKDVALPSAALGQVEVGDTARSRSYRVAVDDVRTTATDVVPPTTPTGVTPLLARGGGAVTVAWVPAKDNVAVTGYDVYRDGRLLAGVGLHSVYRDTEVPPGSSPVYTVRTRDAAGNVSAASTPAAVDVPLTASPAAVAGAVPPVGAVVHALTHGATEELRTQQVAEAVETGLTWIRVGVQWSRIQPRKPTATDPGFDYAGAVADLDRFVQRAHAAGLRLNLLLTATPNWANGGQGPKVLPTDPADYGRLAEWAAARYGASVQSWEVYNEPNLALQTVATPETYTRLLCAAHAGFHRGDADALVVSGATAGNDWQWYQQLYAAGARGCFDVLATHPYQAYSLPPDYPAQDRQRWWTDNIRLVRDVMVANGDGAVPVWFTEFGWSTHANYPGMLERQIGVTRAEQAEYTVDMLRRTVEEYPYVKRVAIYQMRDVEFGNIRNDNYGLYALDMQPKPVATAVRDFLATSVQPLGG